jgi:hypothetical protein
MAGWPPKSPRNLTPGTYLVVLVVTTPGLPPQRRGFVLVLK